MSQSLFSKFYSPEHAKSILRVGWPLIVNNLAIMGINLTDTIMAGRLNTETLAAIATGGAIWTILFIFGMGIIMALSPITAQLVGSGQDKKVGSYIRQGLWLSIFIGIPLTLLGQNAEPAFAIFKLEPELISYASDYLDAITLSLPFVMFYMSLRMVSEGIGHTRPIMYITLFCVCTNIFFNWVLMYGNLGFPAMGAKGCGYASMLNFIIMAVFLTLYVKRTKVYEVLEIFKQFEWPNYKILKEIFALGVPISITTVAEMGLFACATLLMGTFGTNTVAAHQIAINYAAFMFMVPFGASAACTSVIGNLIGQNKLQAARHAGFTGISLSVGFMSLSAIVMILFAQSIIGLYTTDPVVATIAVSLLGVAAAFQIVDGLQVAALGALRDLCLDWLSCRIIFCCNITDLAF